VLIRLAGASVRKTQPGVPRGELKDGRGSTF
jgi:hypothetical protein